jgi:DNA-binding transcriptional LysR family regulator
MAAELNTIGQNAQSAVDVFMDSNRLDWSLCRVFLAIAREGSLSGAARRLGVTHPTVRRDLGLLEDALESALFVRSTSGLIPTDLAIELQPIAQSMEAVAEAFMRTASAEAVHIAGTVRITSSELVGVEILPQILAPLAALHPGLQIELAPTRATEDLLRREADIAVRMTRPSQLDLVARKVGRVRLGFYAHERWLAQQPEPDTLSDLVRSRAMIGYDRDPALLRVLRSAGLEVEPTAFVFRCDSDLAQLAALRAGIGVGVCHDLIARRDPALRRVLPEVGYTLEVWLAATPSLRSTARVAATFEALASGLTALVGYHGGSGTTVASNEH